MKMSTGEVSILLHLLNEKIVTLSKIAYNDNISPEKRETKAYCKFKGLFEKLAAIPVDTDQEGLPPEETTISEENKLLRRAFLQRTGCRSCDHYRSKGNCDGCNLADLGTWLRANSK